MNDRISRRRMMQAAVAATVFAGHSTATFRNARGATTGPRGFALCLGLNHVNPTAYGGHDAPLGGCKFDCERMTALAKSKGFYPIPLINEQANIRDVRNHIKWAAHSLLPGDIFMFSCASHGSQRSDASSDEPDRKDETLCLWDERWVDDDRLELWTRFAKGVRILLVIDTCHSASTARAIEAETDFAVARNVAGERGVPASTGGVVPRDLQIVAAEQNSIDESLAAISRSLPAYKERLKNAEKPIEMPRSLQGRGDFGKQFNIPNGGTSPIRALPDDLSLYLSQFENPFPAAAETRSMKSLRAGVVTLAACQDDESAWDDGKSGLFTNSLYRTWDGGQFTGNYDTFFKAVAEPLKRVGRQHPMKDAFGDTDAFLRQTPFTI